MADIKIGTRHYDLSATDEKRERITKKQEGTTTNSHAVRLVDAKIRKNGEVVKIFSRDDGNRFNISEFTNAVREFVPDSLKNKLILELQIILGKFAEMRQKYPGFRIYSSSLLIIYDGDAPEKGISVKLIDLAHSYLNVEEHGGKADDPDLEDNVILGVRNLITFLL
ncbi:inositol polyphosphate kinase family protein [Tritrichomonas foetus]|uniref:Kinase n=1 Tax=Tritrichomonas foetus TaxID=1144522 RepID=A0A1J4J5H2_9EUKA|nr:inositol polyphosphate kinase family protein [Tritrichomonas foetus]|eukprot:OHS92891.1 inositol polyphosphate kinase family protein [Tritrichomonas foetus]